MKIIFYILAFVFTWSQLAVGQVSSQNRFVNPLDESLGIKRVAVAPFTDNVSNIYAKSLDGILRDSVRFDQQWALMDLPENIKSKYKFGFFDNNTSAITDLKRSSQVDALLIGHLIKGPSGIQINLQLISTQDAKVITQSEIKNFAGFSTKEVEEELIKLFRNLKDSLPYRAMILSRRGNQVTINVGNNYGLKANDEMTVVQFLKLNRHPKHQFIVSSEKEVIGKIQIFKVDDALSFATITFEKENGVIQAGSKVLGMEFKQYPLPVLGPDGKLMSSLESRADAQVAFGKNPTEWVPEPAPQFGRLGIYLGLGSHSHQTSLQTVGTIEGNNSVVPEIMAQGELWFSKEWQFGFKLRQSVFSYENDLTGSSPDKINGSLNQYDARLLYNVLFDNDFFGPKWQVGLGFSQSQFTVSKSSPLAFADHNYGGLYLNIGGSFPVSNEIPLNVGADLKYFITKSLAESDSNSTRGTEMNSFAVTSEYALSQKYRIRGELSFDYYASNLSGATDRTNAATDTSHRLTTLFLGVDYLF
ncbi:MAG: hypothetical protein ACLGGX_00465 [Bdellovibrionia bacterium]